MGTVYVTGDISGHAGVFEQLICSIGGDPDRGYMPPGQVLVHTGDLVHKGPDSAACVQVARRMMQGSPGQFYTLWGNHCASYVQGAPSVQGRQLVIPVDEDTARQLRNWWYGRHLPMALAVSSPQGPVLITHAGLTVGFWRQLGSPDAVGAAQALNAMVGTDVRRALRPGCLTGGPPRLDAGPCWAETGQELLQPWMDHVAAGGHLPFSQVHGHASVVQSWDSCRLWPHIPPRVAASVVLDPGHRRYTLNLDGYSFTGVDWMMGAYPPDPLSPLLALPDADVLA